MSKPPIIAVDFDGTIVRHEFPRVGPPAPHAARVLRKFAADYGARLILFTMRSDGRPDGSNPLQDAVGHCNDLDVPLWGVNENPEQKHWTASNKVYAHFYIDDAAVGCPLITEPGSRPYVDWLKIEELLEPVLRSW